MAQTSLTQKARIQMGVRAVLAPIALVAILFGLAGRWDYWQGWVYLVLNTLIVVIMGTLLTPDRELVEERLNPKQGVKSWDRVYFALSTPLYFVAVGLGGLEAEALVLLGETYLRMKKVDRARAAFEKVLHEYPASPFVVPARRFLQNIGS